jgi:AcrR family transcriptional regulator
MSKKAVMNRKASVNKSVSTRKAVLSKQAVLNKKALPIKKVLPKRVHAKQRRLSPDDRRKEFVAKATEFFSEEGFGGGTRDLARRLGVTQPLLYRYFPSKDDLIKEVYRTVYLEPIDPGWDKLLTDRSRSVRDRLQDFYAAYTTAIFTRRWLRIYLYSGLKGLDINRWYVGMVRDKILTRIVRECRHEAGLPAQSKPTAAELELTWVFHSGIFYYGVRKYIYESPVLEDKEKMISDALDTFLAGYRQTFAKAVATSLRADITAVI